MLHLHLPANKLVYFELVEKWRWRELNPRLERITHTLITSLIHFSVSELKKEMDKYLQPLSFVNLSSAPKAKGGKHPDNMTSFLISQEMIKRMAPGFRLELAQG